jgi:molybdate transport system regulatory protein
MKLSARNQRPAPSRESTRAQRSTIVEPDVNGQRVIASITIEAARELGLEESKTVTAIVKASDVIFAVPD